MDARSHNAFEGSPVQLIDAERLPEALRTAVRPNTRAAYPQSWERWTRSVKVRGENPIPARPERIAAFLKQQAESFAVLTVLVARSAIRKAHLLRNLDDPTKHPLPVQAVKSVKLEAKI